MRSPASNMSRRQRAPAGPARRDLLLLAAVAMMVMVLLGPMMTIADVTMTGEGNPLRQAGYIVIAAVTIIALRPFRDPMRLLRVPPPLLIAVGICWISLIWALDPEIAVRRLILLTVVVWMTCVMVGEMGYDLSVSMLRFVLVGALVCDFAAVFGWPQLGIHQMNERGDYQLLGDWRGFVMHKNTAGALTAATLLLFVFDSRRVPMAVRIAVAAAAAVFLYFTHSRTSVGMALVALVAGFAYLRVPAKHRVWLIGSIFLAGLLLVLFVDIYRDPLARAVSDVNTLTGRPYIWTAVLNYAGDHLLLGAGFGSFWNIAGGGPIYGYGKDWILTITSAHNGFLDLLIQLGLPATIIVIGMLVVWPIGRLLVRQSISAQRGALLSALLIFCVGHNLTESSFLDRDSIMSVVLIFTIALIWIADFNTMSPSVRRSGATRPSQVPYI